VLFKSENSVDSVTISTWEWKYPKFSLIRPVAGFSFINWHVKINLTLIGFFCWLIRSRTFGFALMMNFFGS